MNTYRPKYFILQELVGPAIFQERGERCWEFIRPELLITLDALRDRYGRTIINNWHKGGDFHESGLRSPTTSTGAKYSLHKFGCAADPKFESATPEEIGIDIVNHPDKYPLLTTIENPLVTKTWLHVDVRNHNQPRIWVVDP